MGPETLAKGLPYFCFLMFAWIWGEGGKVAFKSDIYNGMGDGAEEEGPFGHLALDVMLSRRHTHPESWTLSVPSGVTERAQLWSHRLAGSSCRLVPSLGLRFLILERAWSPLPGHSMTTIRGQVLSRVVVALTEPPAGLQLQLRKARRTPTKHTKGHPRHAVGSAPGDRGCEAAMAGPGG